MNATTEENICFLQNFKIKKEKNEEADEAGKPHRSA